MEGRREIAAFKEGLLRIDDGIWFRMKRFGWGFDVGCWVVAMVEGVGVFSNGGISE